MNNQSILEYIKASKNDIYCIEVLYYYLKKALAENDYTIHNCSSISFGKDFFLESVSLSIGKKIESSADSFALLLSVRAVLVDSTLIGHLNGEHLLFQPTASHKFEWVKYISLITKLLVDDEFKAIFTILCHVCQDKMLSREDILWLCNSLNPPKSKLAVLRLPIEAKRTDVKFTAKVVCNNAYVGDEELEEFDVPETIEYIGDTAFAYCPNLSVIRFFRPDIKFGIFPIIECENLDFIVVPDGSEDYYKEALPHYKDIIIPASEEYDEEEEVDEEEVDNSYFEDTISHVFDSISTSYKYFWFKSIIELNSISPERTEEDLTITFDELIISMCAFAWPIVMGHRMQFSSTDQLSKYLLQLKRRFSILDGSDISDVYQILEEHYDETLEIISPLKKNVPYRFLSPWIKYDSDAGVIAKSQDDDYYGPYAITEDKTIVLEKHWAEYFYSNREELSSFIFDSLCKYMAKHNYSKEMKEFKDSYEF